MASAINYFDVKFPPRNYISCDGGLNTKTAKQWLLDNESPDCLNVIYGQGTVETRPGSLTLNTAAVGSFACDGLYTRHISTGSESLTGWWNGTLYYLSGTTFVSVSESSGVLSAGVRVCASEYENYIFYSNGNAIPYKYNGTFTRMGVYPPTTTSTVATHASGYCLATGTYNWRVTYVNSNLVESDMGPITATFTASGGTGVYLTSLPTAAASFGVNHRYVYRSNDDGSHWYRAGTVANNTATTYVDVAADAALVTAGPTDQGVPPFHTMSLTHQSRIFFIGRYDANDPLWIWYTEANNPYVVKATNYRAIGDATSEIPSAIAVWDNFLIVLCKSGTVWAVYMPDNDDSNWVDIKVRGNFGSESPFGVFNAMNKVIFPATQNNQFVGFSALTAAGIDPEASMTEVGAVGSELLSEMIESEIDLFNTSYVQNISSIVYKNKAYISYAYNTSTNNNRILVLDFSMSNLSKKQKYTWAPWTGLNIAQFAVYDGVLYGASSSTNGFVYKLLQSNYHDSGTAINSYYATKEFYGLPGHEVWYKDWRWVNILYELSGDWSIGVAAAIDSDLGDGTYETIDVNPGTALWGYFTYGYGTWEAGRSERDLKKSLGRYKGKRIQLKFSNLNTVGSKFKIAGLSIRYNLKGKR